MFNEISNKTKENLRKHGITGLFPIQVETFNAIYQKTDLVARDLTGSGKTLAFALPLVERMRKEGLFSQRNKNRVIIMTPTRELAIQVSEEIKKLSHYPNEISVSTIYGGVPYERQERDLRNQVDFIVATTGRTLDHIERGNINLENVQSIILDEADRMLDMGFEPDIKQIIKEVEKQCKKKPQFLLFSATIPFWVKKIAASYLDPNYKFIDLAKNLKNKTAKEVSHVMIPCEDENKVNALGDVLKMNYGPDKKIIVF